MFGAHQEIGKGMDGGKVLSVGILQSVWYKKTPKLEPMTTTTTHQQQETHTDD